jgi:alpha/beta superfamily hydrolase
MKRFLVGLLKTVAWVAGIYLLVLIAIYLLQDFLMYPGRALYREGSAEWKEDISVLRTYGYEAIEIPGDSQRTPTLIGAFHRPESRATAILWFHGREESLTEIGHQLKALRGLGLHAFAMEYRGFGRAEGNPGEKAILEDAKRALDWIREQEGVDDRRMFVGGYGLGAVVAIRAAAEYDLDGVIALSPFGSIAEVVSKHAPFVPLKVVLSDKWDSRDAARGLRCPLFVAYGADAPPDRVQAAKDLAEIRGNGATLHEVAGATEATIFSKGGLPLWDAAMESLR